MTSLYCSLSRALVDRAQQLLAYMATPLEAVPLYSKPILFLIARVSAPENGHSPLVEPV